MDFLNEITLFIIVFSLVAGFFIEKLIKKLHNKKGEI